MNLVSAANERLLKIRRELAETKPGVSARPSMTAPARPADDEQPARLSWQMVNAQNNLNHRRNQREVGGRWTPRMEGERDQRGICDDPGQLYAGRAGSFTLPPSQALARIASQQAERGAADQPAQPAQPAQPEIIRSYPAIGLAALQNNPATYRLWLAVRHRAIVAGNSTWVARGTVVAIVTDELKQTRQTAWRLLTAGEGVYWTSDLQGRDRLWLRGAAAVAKSLGVEKLTGAPVALPLEAVFKPGLAAFKCALFDSYHSGKRGNGTISRAKIEEITGIKRRSQQRYDRARGVNRRKNWLIDHRNDRATVEKMALEHGNAIFPFHDHDGSRSGEAGRDCTARRLPSTYTGTLKRARPGRVRKIQKSINASESVSKRSGLTRRKRLFFDIETRGNGSRRLRDGYFQLDERSTGAFWRAI